MVGRQQTFRKKTLANKRLNGFKKMSWIKQESHKEVLFSSFFFIGLVVFHRILKVNILNRKLMLFLKHLTKYLRDLRVVNLCY